MTQKMTERAALRASPPFDERYGGTQHKPGVTWEFEGWGPHGMWSVYWFDTEQEAAAEFRRVYREWQENERKRKGCSPREPVLLRVERSVQTRGKGPKKGRKP